MNKNQFIKKYYWIIVLVFLIVAYFAKNEEPNPYEESTTTEHNLEIDNQEASKEQETDFDAKEYKFRNESLLNQHYEKHGVEMGFDSAKEYEAAASEVVNHPDALHKIEAEDGDDVYYLEATNEFVIVSGDGYLRTYFYPNDGIDYYNRQ